MKFKLHILTSSCKDVFKINFIFVTSFNFFHKCNFIFGRKLDTQMTSLKGTKKDIHNFFQFSFSFGGFVSIAFLAKNVS